MVDISVKGILSGVKLASDVLWDSMYYGIVCTMGHYVLWDSMNYMVVTIKHSKHFRKWQFLFFLTSACSLASLSIVQFILSWIQRWPIKSLGQLYNWCRRSGHFTSAHQRAIVLFCAMVSFLVHFEGISKKAGTLLLPDDPKKFRLFYSHRPFQTSALYYYYYLAQMKHGNNKTFYSNYYLNTMF